jgi:hypothetical protein
MYYLIGSLARGAAIFPAPDLKGGLPYNLYKIDCYVIPIEVNDGNLLIIQDSSLGAE